MGEAENAYGRRAVGRYKIYAAIAAGGMATVHYGRMLGPLGFSRTVAIKRLHPEYARDPEFVAMFLDEARLAARIHHPNVVQTLDVVASDGEIFLVMEYVPALSLSQLLIAAQVRREHAPAAVAASVIVDALNGLHAAHEATDEEGSPLDIVHRDVSPHNVLVGADGRARVLDFGVAKAAGRATQATREGQVKGKFAYMSPEQVTNVGVSRKSDVFAASIVLWEALTGTRLFQADSEPALLARVLSGVIAPPSSVVPDLGPAIDAVVMRGLERDPSARYADASEMARALEAAVSLASGSQVGRWVEDMAGDELSRRSARVAEIENESRSEQVSVATAMATSKQTAGDATALESQSTEPKAAAHRKRAAYRWAAVLGLIAAGVLVVGASLATRRAPPRQVSEAPRPASTAISSPTDRAPERAERGQAEPDGPGSAAAPASNAARSARAADPKPARDRSGAPPPPPSARKECDPPYFVDSNGHLIYKVACFQ